MKKEFKFTNFNSKNHQVDFHFTLNFLYQFCPNKSLSKYLTNPLKSKIPQYNNFQSVQQTKSPLSPHQSTKCLPTKKKKPPTCTKRTRLAPDCIEQNNRRKIDGSKLFRSNLPPVESWLRRYKDCVMCRALLRLFVAFRALRRLAIQCTNVERILHGDSRANGRDRDKDRRCVNDVIRAASNSARNIDDEQGTEWFSFYFAGKFVPRVVYRTGHVVNRFRAIFITPSIIVGSVNTFRVFFNITGVSFGMRLCVIYAEIWFLYPLGVKSSNENCF